MMPLGGWAMLAWMLFVISTGIGLLLWAWRNGQLHNIEEAKYRMLDDAEPEPWTKEPRSRVAQPPSEEEASWPRT